MTGIIDRIEEGFAVVELPEGMVNIPLAGSPDGLREGLVVVVEAGQIIAVDEAESARRAAAMRSRFARLKRRKQKE